MNMKALRGCGVILFGALILLGIIGCAPQEDLIVPPVSAMVGKLQLRQTYVLQRPTMMAAMDTGDVQPEIHLRYDKKTDGPPPAEALERVAFPVWGEEQVQETDPNNPSGPPIWVTEPVPAYWDGVTLDTGTQIAVTWAEIYGNSHVYRGRILNGFAHNCYVLLVVPVGDNKLPTAAQLQAEDQGYLAPLVPARAASTTAR